MANLPFGDSRVLHLDPTIGIKSIFYGYFSFLAQKGFKFSPKRFEFAHGLNVN